jgi:DNA-binding NarL/FixJ family response regulator
MQGVAFVRTGSPGSVRRALDVALIEDHPLFRDALAEVLRSAMSANVVLTAGSVEEYERRLRRPPDLTLLDLGLPGVSGAAAVRRVQATGTVVLALSATYQESSVLEALASGARGYLCKDVDAAEVVTAVRAVAGGGSYVSPRLAGDLLRAAGTGTSVPRETCPLTPREQEVLGLLGGGETDHGIAKALSISVATVRSHLDRIRDKTGRRRRPDLTRLALEHALVPPELVG